MRKAEVEVGKCYSCKVSGELTTVRIVKESRYGGWDGKNLKTGRLVRIKSAAKLRMEVADPSKARPRKAPKPLGRVEKPSDPLEGIKRRGYEGGSQRGQEAPHLMVKALAGTGKTFTKLVGVANLFRDEVWDLTIRHLGFNPTPSEEQKAIWDEMRVGRTPKSIVACAFNNSIVREFNSSYKWLKDALQRNGISFGFSTIHSLGFSAIKKAYGLTRDHIDEYRTRRIIENYLNVDWREYRKEEPNKRFTDAVEKLTSYCKLTLTNPSEESLFNLAVHFGVDPSDDWERVVNTVPDILNISSTQVRSVNFDDMVWLPVVNDLRTWKNDLLLVDECQDLNRAQQELAKKCGYRLIVVGDENQAIYGFAGADAEAMGTLERDLGDDRRGCKILTLTETRRCGKAIVEEARKDVESFRAHEDNPPGEIFEMDLPEAFDEIRSGDMVLSRTVAPIVGLCFRFLAAGRAAYVLGRNVADKLFGHIDRISELKSFKKGDGDEVTRFVRMAGDYFERERAKVEAAKHPNEERLIALKDEESCLRVFCKGAEDLRSVRNRIDETFTNETGSGILLSSGHKSKGLEADRVFFLNPDSIPHPMAKGGWQIQQEINLRYVMRTRAIHTLVYVYGEEDEVEE